jgi:hypothetical protein
MRNLLEHWTVQWHLKEKLLEHWTVQWHLKEKLVRKLDSTMASKGK